MSFVFIKQIDLQSQESKAMLFYIAESWLREDGWKEGHGYMIYYEEGENDEVERIVHRVYMSFLWDRSYILKHVFFLTLSLFGYNSFKW